MIDQSNRAGESSHQYNHDIDNILDISFQFIPIILPLADKNERLLHSSRESSIIGI